MSTTHQAPKLSYEPLHLPDRNRVPLNAPLQWLKAGWQYWRSNPLPSLAYGLVFAAVGAVITLLGLSKPQFIFTFWSGFLLVGPFFAMGLYRLAQQTDQGKPLKLSQCLRVMGEQRAMVGIFSIVLALIMIAWIRVSTLAVALYVGNVPTAASILTVLNSAEGIGFIATLFGVGLLFAAGMFLITAWSLPMVVDDKADLAVAIASSVKAIMEQPLPMLLWAGIVSGLTVIGMLTLFIGFIVIFPLLGYATWSGYKALFKH